MEPQQSRVDVFEKVTWKIENFSRLNNEKLYSEPVILGGYPWRILLYPGGNKVEYLSIYLDAVESANMCAGWSRVMTYRLFVFNQVDANKTIRRECNHEFNAKEIDWGFTSFMPLAKFRDPKGGFLVNDACIVGVEVSVHKSRHENQAASLIVSLKSEGHKEVEIPRPEPVSELSNLELFSASVGELIDFRGLRQIEKAFVPLEIPRPEPVSKLSDLELFSASIGELVDFMGLGQIEKAFVPLLEKVCSQHPSLIECQLKRSRKFTEWAFTALGRVLYFLNTRKAKDMNGLACKDLQILWEELETFRFDLTWLEPHVQSALGMKDYVEKAMRLKENVVALELERERLKAKLVSNEVNLDAARDLLKAKCCEEVDLDAGLGYGVP